MSLALLTAPPNRRNRTCTRTLSKLHVWTFLACRTGSLLAIRTLDCPALPADAGGAAGVRRAGGRVVSWHPHVPAAHRALPLLGGHPQPVAAAGAAALDTAQHFVCIIPPAASSPAESNTEIGRDACQGTDISGCSGSQEGCAAGVAGDPQQAYRHGGAGAAQREHGGEGPAAGPLGARPGAAADPPTGPGPPLDSGASPSADQLHPSST